MIFLTNKEYRRRSWEWFRTQRMLQVLAEPTHAPDTNRALVLEAGLVSPQIARMACGLMGVVERRSDIDLRATNALLDAVEKDSDRVGVIRYLPAPPEGRSLVVTDGEQWTVLGVVMTPDGPRIKVRIEQLPPALTPKEDK